MSRNTPAPIQQFRGSASSLDQYTGPVGEVTMDTTNKTVRVQDGSTVGGHTLVNTTTAQSIGAVKTFTAAPTAPTPSKGTTDTTAATTEFVKQSIEDIDIDDFPTATKDQLGFMQVGEGLHVKDGVIGLGETIKPMILNPSSGATVSNKGFMASATPFRTSYISDTHVSTRWMIVKDSVIVADVTSTTDLESHTFTAQELSGVTAGAALIMVQYEGEIAGKSDFSDAVDITVQMSSVNKPTITAPQNNSTVTIPAGVTVSTSSFGVTGGTDTHKNTDYKITSDPAGENIVAQALASTDLVSHVFSPASIASMSAGSKYYITARHRGNTLGESAWANTITVTAQAGQVFAGRTIYRHPSNKGSVIVYDEFGATKNILVYDAAYRSRSNKQWGQPDVDIPGINNWPHYYYPTCAGNVIDSSSGYINLGGVADLTPYSAQLSDAHFQKALTATLKPVLQTAKAATDILMNYSDTAAAHFCRDQNSVIPGIEGQLPNIYQSLVMFACGDIIDSLDPTVAQYPNNALGKYTNSTRLFSYGVALSSTEYSATFVCYMNCQGYTHYNWAKTKQLSVAPVAEL